MSLKDSLYHIVSCESGKAVVRLDPSSPVYAAHFPGYPITPGVILIEIATELLSAGAACGSIDGCADGCIDGAADGRIDRAVGGCIDEVADGRIDGAAGGLLELSEAVNVKFVSPVIPGEETLLTYLFAPDGELRWKVNVLCSETLCAKMTLQYR